MASLDIVSAAIQNAVENALNDAGYSVPVLQVGVGAPFGPSLSEILGQNQAQITVFPLDGASRNLTNRRPTWKPLDQLVPPLQAVIEQQFGDYTLTFIAPSPSGVMWDFTPPFQWDSSPPAEWDNYIPAPIPPGINVHTFFGAPVTDFAYQTQEGETTFTLAAAVASGINAAHYDLVFATVNINRVTIYESPYLYCNIGWTGTNVREVRRMMTPFQVTVWAANPDDRTLIGNIIDSAVAIDTVPFLQGSDFSAIRIRLQRPSWNDDSQSSYSLYAVHFVYECEYPTLQTASTTTVEGVGSTLKDGSETKPPNWSH